MSSGYRITREHLAHLGASESRAERTLEKQKEMKREMTRKGMLAGGSLAASAGFGWLQGRKGGMPETMGIPWDAAVGAAGIIGGFFDFKGSEVVLGLGLGAGGWALGNIMGGLGQKMRRDAKDTPGTPFTSADPKKDPNNSHGVDPRAFTAGSLPQARGNVSREWSETEMRAAGLVR